MTWSVDADNETTEKESEENGTGLVVISLHLIPEFGMIAVDCIRSEIKYRQERR